MSTSQTRSWFDTLIDLLVNAQPTDRLILHTLLLAVVGSSIWLVISINNFYSSETPVLGGTITEGVVGVPRFINPTLAITRADQDLSALMYRRLMLIDPSGTLVPDVAETVTVSDDGTEYRIVLKRDIRFHDGTPLTSRDVNFTIQLIQNPDLKSPLRGNWSNVIVTEDDEYTLRVTLNEPYAPFIENFTLGILPAHVWSNLTIEEIPFSHLNSEPIGSGPLQIANVTRNAAGQVTEYRLMPSPYTNLEPRIRQLNVRFFPNETELYKALLANTIDGTTYLTSAYEIPTTHKYIDTPLPRLFGIFFNENRNPALQDIAARQALSIAIERTQLVTTALGGAGVPTHTPVFFATNTLESMYGITEDSSMTPLERASEHLQSNGWRQEPDGVWKKTIDGSVTELTITLKTNNTDIFIQTARAIEKIWQELGVRVTIEQYDQSSLVQTVIRPRDFESLLFGIDLNRSEDLFPFWHSSQKDDPGLNIAQYTNIRVDELLSEARTTQDEIARRELLNTASTIITTETPAIFLFQPSLRYVIAPDIIQPNITRIARPADRFMNIALWHRNRAHLWPWFHSTQQ